MLLFIINSILWNIFALPFDYKNHKLTMFLWPQISHINEPDIYILSHINANSKG